MTHIAAEPRTLVCTEDGVYIWPGVPLVARRGVSYVRASERDIANLVGTSHGPEAIYGSLIPTLERCARLLEQGQLARAQATIAKLKLPPLTPLGESLMRIAPGFFDPDKHPRWPAGQSDGGQFRPADDGQIVPVADKTPPELPKDRPPTPTELNRFGRLQSQELRARMMAEGLSRGAAIAQLLAMVPTIVDNAHAVYSRIASRFDEPMTLDELIARSYGDSPPEWPPTSDTTSSRKRRTKERFRTASYKAAKMSSASLIMYTGTYPIFIRPPTRRMMARVRETTCAARASTSSISSALISCGNSEC